MAISETKVVEVAVVQGGVPAEWLGHCTFHHEITASTPGWHMAL